MESASEAKIQGNALFSSGKYEDAINTYLKGCELADSNEKDIIITLKSNIIMSYIKLQQYQNALNSAETILPDIPATHPLLQKIRYRGLTSIMGLYNKHILTEKSLSNPTTKNYIEKAQELIEQIQQSSKLPEIKQLDNASQQQVLQWKKQISSQPAQQLTAREVSAEGMDFATLQKIASQRNDKANTQSKPQGVWGRGGGLALSKQIQKESNGVPIVLTTTPASSIDEKKLPSLKEKSDKINKLLTSYNTTINSNKSHKFGYFGSIDNTTDQQERWRNLSVAPRRIDVPTTDFRTSSGSDNENADEETIQKQQERRTAYNKKLLSEQKERQDKNKKIISSSSSSVYSLNGVFDGCNKPVTDHPMEESISILLTNNDKVWLLGNKLEESNNQESTNDNDNSNENIEQNSDDVDQEYKKYKWEFPRMSTYELEKRCSALLPQLKNKDILQIPSLSDGVYFALDALLEKITSSNESSQNIITKITPQHIIAIHEYVSMRHPRRVEYIIRVEIEVSPNYSISNSQQSPVVIAPFSKSLIEQLALKDYTMTTLFNNCSSSLPFFNKNVYETTSSSSSSPSSPQFIGTPLDNVTCWTQHIRDKMNNENNIELQTTTPTTQLITLHHQPLYKPLPFSTVQLITISIPPPETFLPPAILLVNRYSDIAHQNPPQFDLPITHLESADSIGFTVTRLLHNLFGVLTKSVSLLSLQRSGELSSLLSPPPVEDESMPSFMRPPTSTIWSNGAGHFTAVTILYGKQHQKTNHPRLENSLPPHQFSPYWPSRTKPSAVDYQWITQEELSQQQISQNTIDLLTYVFNKTQSSQYHYNIDKNDKSDTDDNSEHQLDFPLGVAGLVSLDVIQLQSNNTKE